MKVKNQFLVIAILTIFLGILLCSCKTENSEVPEDRYSVFQKGFASSMGNKIVESPDGFYLFNGNFLTFLDKNFENPVTVCDKPECRHLEEAEEHVVECNAFYGNPRDIKYYNGKLYIAADAMDGANQAIYQVDLDGNGRNKIYTAENQGEFCFLIYKGDIIAYEQQYNETQVSAEIIRFPINDPKQAETLFSGKETDINNSGISYLINDEDNLYFNFVDREKWTDIRFYTTDLTSNETERICKDADRFLLIGSDRLIGSENIERNNEDRTWENKYFQFSKDGKLEKELTDKDYEALSRGAIIDGIDDQYIYLSDICYGADAPPAEERYHYIYTYDGKEAGRIYQTGTDSLSFYPGNDDYAIIQDYDGTEQVYYKVDKSLIESGQTLEPIEFFRFDPTEFSYFYSY